MLKSAGIPATGYASVVDFSNHVSIHLAGCLILELNLPDCSGLELQQWLSSTENNLPVIFLTENNDIPSCVLAMKSGAMNFLTKPTRPEILLPVIRAAFLRNLALRQEQAALRELRHRFAQLTAREDQVIKLVATSLLNKQIAAQLGTVEKTVKVHRSRALAKLGIRSVVDLVHLLERHTASLAPDAPVNAPYPPLFPHAHVRNAPHRPSPRVRLRPESPPILPAAPLPQGLIALPIFLM